jgi:hypothetical protein
MERARDHYIEYAEACRQRAAVTLLPNRRERLLSIARLHERDAALVSETEGCIDESWMLIRHAEQLLRH